jgi:hypothetical protein
LEVAKGGYYDPPFKCRVPISKKRAFELYSPKGLRSATFRLHLGYILGYIL